MKNVKKVLAVCLVALFAVGVLAACGKSGGDTPAPAGSGSAADGGAVKKHYIITVVVCIEQCSLNIFID